MAEIVHHEEAARRLASGIKTSSGKASKGSLNFDGTGLTNLSGIEAGRQEHQSFTALARRSGECSDELAEKIKTVAAVSNRLDADQAHALKKIG